MNSTTSPRWSGGFDPETAARRWHGLFGVAGEFFRTVVDPYTGNVRANRRLFDLALSAGVLADLIIANRLNCAGHTAPSGELITAAAITLPTLGTRRDPLPMETQVVQLVNNDSGRSAHHWIQKLAELDIYHAVGQVFVDMKLMDPIDYRSPADRILHRKPSLRLVACDGWATQSQFAGSRVPNQMARGERLTTADIAQAVLLEAIGWRRRLEKESGKSMLIDPYLPDLPPQIKALLNCARAVLGNATTSAYTR